MPQCALEIAEHPAQRLGQRSPSFRATYLNVSRIGSRLQYQSTNNLTVSFASSNVFFAHRLNNRHDPVRRSADTSPPTSLSSHGLKFRLQPDSELDIPSWLGGIIETSSEPLAGSPPKSDEDFSSCSAATASKHLFENPASLKSQLSSGGSLQHTLESSPEPRWDDFLTNGFLDAPLTLDFDLVSTIAEPAQATQQITATTRTHAENSAAIDVPTESFEQKSGSNNGVDATPNKSEQSVVDDDGDVEDMAPARCSDNIGDRLTLFASTTRARAAQATTTRRAAFTQANVDKHTEQMDGVRRLGQCFDLDAHLHMPASGHVTDDADCEVAGSEWDLPSARYDSVSQRVVGGVPGAQTETITIPFGGVMHLMLRIRGPVAIYAFPLHGIIEVRAEAVAYDLSDDMSPQARQNPFALEFDVGPLFAGLLIHSDSPLPKIWFDYHLYTPRFPLGLPSTGAQLASLLDQLSTFYESHVASGYAPYAAVEAYRILLGSSFTLLPMSTVDPSARAPFNRIYDNARLEHNRNWAAKVRAGDRLLKVGNLSPVFLAEAWPWQNSDEIPRGAEGDDRYHILMPTEGFWTEQMGKSRRQWIEIGGGWVLQQIFDTFNEDAQGYEAANDFVRHPRPALCDDAGVQFGKWMAPSQWLEPWSQLDEMRATRRFNEHAALGFTACQSHHYESCPCIDDLADPDPDPVKASYMVRDSDGVQHCEEWLCQNWVCEQWLENIQHNMTHCRSADGKDILAWIGDDAFLLKKNKTTALIDPTVFGNSGFLPEQLDVPSCDDFLRPFQFEDGGYAHEIPQRRQDVYPARLMPWMPGYTEPFPPFVDHLQNVSYGYTGCDGCSPAPVACPRTPPGLPRPLHLNGLRHAQYQADTHHDDLSPVSAQYTHERWTSMEQSLETRNKPGRTELSDVPYGYISKHC